MLAEGRRFAAALALTLLATGAGSGQEPAGQVISSEQAEERARNLRRISDRLICQCSCNMILSECNHQSCPFAVPERKKILALVDEGRSDDEIVEQFVQDYGRKILSTPPIDGSLLDRSAWLVPFFALVLGGIMVGMVVKHLTRERPASAAAQAGSTSTARTDPYLERVEQELSGQDDKRTS